jgi:hypothetical protein
MQKRSCLLIVGEEEEKMHHFYPSSWTGRKGKHQHDRRFAAIVDEERSKDIKSIYSLTKL